MNLYRLIGKKVKITGPYVASESYYGTVTRVQGSYVCLDSHVWPFDMDPEGFVGFNGGYSIVVLS
jgi:hypothetical protein